MPVELPSNDWSLKRFRRHQSIFAHFSAFLHHAPTGKYALIFCHGNDKPLEMIWADDSDGVKNAWDEFVDACHNIASSEEEIIYLIVAEQMRQKNFSGILGTGVGNVIYREPVEALWG